MFMRYLGGGIGHQKQDARWAPLRGDEVDNDAMDVDPCEDEAQLDNDQQDRRQMQELRELAIEMSSWAAGDDDKGNNSEEHEVSDDDDDDEDELFLDDEEEEDCTAFDFGPYDGEEDEDDTGFDNL